jgi:hypothetical protein
LIRTADARLRPFLGEATVNRLKFRLESFEHQTCPIGSFTTQHSRGSVLSLASESCRPEIKIKTSIWIEVLHLALIVYTSFTIPFELAFQIDIVGPLLFIEIGCCVESVVYILIRAYLIAKELKRERKFTVCEALRSYYSRNQL